MTTNIHHTLKKKPMRFEDLSDFVSCYNPQNRHKRKATRGEQDTPEGRWRSYSYEEIRARDKTSLTIFWLQDKSLTGPDSLAKPDDLAEEIIANLESGLNSSREVLAGLRHAGAPWPPSGTRSSCQAHFQQTLRGAPDSPLEATL